MSKFLKNFILALFAWEVIIAASVGLMYAVAGKTVLGPEGRRYITFAGALGIIVVVICLPVCRRFRPTRAALTGMIVGLFIPLIVGWISGLLADHWMYSWGHSWTSLETQVEGLQLSVPSAIACGIIGFLLGRQAKEGSRPLPFS